MLNAPRTPCEDSNRQNECYSDNGERSNADRTFPILTIPHAALHVSWMKNAAVLVIVSVPEGVPRRSALTIRDRPPAYGPYSHGRYWPN